MPDLAATVAQSLPMSVRRLGRRTLSHGESLLKSGTAIQCPCCTRTFRALSPHRGQPQSRCPGCWSLPRHRLMLMFLRDSGLLHPAHRVLHMAPEEGIHRHLKHRAVYVGADVQTGPRVTRTFDVQQIPFTDHSFDLVLCSHVLEHVPDDRRALREFARVLAPTGRAVFQHPIDPASDVTAEDPAVVSPAERQRRYGQFDHVRMYGRDFADRLRDAGLEVEDGSYADSLTSEDVARFALQDTSPVSRGEIYVARRATS